MFHGLQDSNLFFVILFIENYKVGCLFVCLSVCQHSNVRLTAPPVLMLWGTQGYLWLPYDLTEVINLIGERFQKIPYVIPSALLSFLPDFCHSFQIFVIPSKYY